MIWAIEEGATYQQKTSINEGAGDTPNTPTKTEAEAEAGAQQHVPVRVPRDPLARGPLLGVAAHGLPGVGLLLIHPHAVDQELRRQALAEPGVHAALREGERRGRGGEYVTDVRVVVSIVPGLRWSCSHTPCT